MKSFTIKINPTIALVSSMIAVIGLSAGVFAAIPSIQGVINGCYSNQNGQLKIIDQAGTCAAGQTNLQWDRGVLAYAHVVFDTTSAELTIPVGQSYNMNLTPSNPGFEQSACLDINLSVEDKVRFVSLAPSDNGMSQQVFVKNKSQDENAVLSVYCTPVADVLMIGSSSAYISVF